MEPELFSALQKGDEAAWEQAFRELYPPVFHAARHPVAGLTPSEAEDVAIDTLRELVSKVPEVQNLDELRALAVTMAARAAISAKRKKSAQKRGSGQVVSMEDLQEKTDGLFEPAATMVDSFNGSELKELSQLLQSALKELEPDIADLIQDYLMEEVPYKMLAEKYEIPIGTVGVQIARGLKKIRKKVESRPKLLKELQAFLR